MEDIWPPDFQAMASICVRLMCNLSLEKVWLLIKCGVYSRLYSINLNLHKIETFLSMHCPQNKTEKISLKGLEAMLSFLGEMLSVQCCPAVGCSL